MSSKIHMGNYLGLLRRIMHEGFTQEGSQGTSVGLLGESLAFKNISDRFPVLTARKMWWKNIAGELMWMKAGSTSIHDLHEYNCNIWDNWADENGNIGPVYGFQLRSWGAGQSLTGHDQLAQWIKNIIDYPHSRRHVLTMWNPLDLARELMPSCILTIQACVTPIPPNTSGVSMTTDIHEEQLNLIVTLRSSDAMLGLPQDIACYALMLRWLADSFGYHPGNLHMHLNNVHIYKNHFEQYQKLMAQAKYMPPAASDRPQLALRSQVLYNRPIQEIINADLFERYRLVYYTPQAAIKMF